MRLVLQAHLWVAMVCGILAVLPAGCGGQRTAQITEEFFFPQMPDPPRIQYLRSFNGSTDLDSGATVIDYLAGSEKAPEYLLQKPFSVATTKGRIYVTDSFGLKSVGVFDLQNRRFYLLGVKDGPSKLRKPIHVSTDAEGFKYVSDLLRRQVVVFGPDDGFVRAYGDGKSFLPVAAIARGNEIYVLDIDKDPVKPAGGTAPANPEKAADAGAEAKAEAEFAVTEIRRDQILVLDKATGRPLRRIGRHDKGQRGFSFASFMTLDRLGNIYVSDAQNHRIVKLDSKGNVSLAFGTHGDRAGQFAFMKGVAVDRGGLIYVVDSGFQAVQVFDNAGTPLFPLGGASAPVGPMSLPAGIYIDELNLEYFRDLVSPEFVPEYLVLVTNQYTDRHRIAVYAYGKRKGVEYPPEKEIVTLDAASTKSLWRMDVVNLESPTRSKGAAPNAPRKTAPKTKTKTKTKSQP